MCVWTFGKIKQDKSIISLTAPSSLTSEKKDLWLRIYNFIENQMNIHIYTKQTFHLKKRKCPYTLEINTCPSFGSINVPRVNLSAPYIYQMSITRLHTCTTWPPLGSMYMYIPRVHHSAPCIYYVFTTQFHLYTTCPPLGSMYVPRVHYSAPSIYQVSTTRFHLYTTCPQLSSIHVPRFQHSDPIVTPLCNHRSPGCHPQIFK